MSETFKAFSSTHAICVAISLAAWILTARRAGQSVRGNSWDSFAKAFGWAIVFCAAGSTLFELLPARFNKDISLPLHLCDFAWFVGGVALLTGRRVFYALTYFWGFGLSSEAFLTPTLKYGPATFDFWSFWVCHWQILAASILTVGAHKFRPSWADFARTVGITATMLLAATAINLSIETNYWFTAPSKPSSPTVIDLLGEWPLRVVWLSLIVIAIFAAMTWPFARRRGARSMPA